jgi:hypothetical protein
MDEKLDGLNTDSRERWQKKTRPFSTGSAELISDLIKKKLKIS